jgi:hypothetical protein
MAQVYVIEGSSGDEAYSYSFVLKRAFNVKLDAEVVVAQIEELMTEGQAKRQAFHKLAEAQRVDARVSPDQRMLNYRATYAEMRLSDEEYVARVNAIVPETVTDIYQNISWDVIELELV